MTSLFDSMIPSRRREQKRLREEEKRLRERWQDDIEISAPNDGCWIGRETTPELEWSSPLTQASFSPDVTTPFVHNSPEIGNCGEQVVIVDTDTDPSAQTYHEEPEKNAITFTIPLPWPARKGHSRSPSASQTNASTAQPNQQASPLPSSQVPVVYKPTSNQFIKELDHMVRGNSPAAFASHPVRHASPQLAPRPLRQTSPMSSMGFAGRSPSPPADQEDGHHISAIMLLSPVVEDFPSRPKAGSAFKRGGSQRHIEYFTRQLPSPPFERPSTAMSSCSTNARSETGTSFSKATGVTEASYYTASTHHTTRSSSRGPGLAHTGTMRSVSRESTTRRAMSREPSERRALSREPTERRAMSREPVNRRAISREPTERRAFSRDPVSRRAISREPSRQRAMTGGSLIRRGQSLEDLRYGFASIDNRAISPSVISDDSSEGETGERKPSNSSAVAGSYYASLANEYRQIAWEASGGQASDSDSLMGRGGKVTKEKPKPKEKETEHYVPAVPSNELVPTGRDLWG